MKPSKLSFFILVLSVMVLASCSGLPPTAGGGGGGGNGTGSVSLTMVADTLPAHPSILSFTVSISALVLTSSTGATQQITLSPPLVVDLMRLQSDTVFIGTVANVPSGAYSSITAFLGIPSQITFLNDTGSTITNLNPTCPNNTVCSVSVLAAGSPTATVSFTVPTTGTVGVGLDLNLSNAVSITAGSLNTAFGDANLLTAFTLPRTGSNLAAGQLDLIEDFTGVVTIGNSGVTLASAPATGRGSLTASTNANMILDKDPSQTICTTPIQGSITSCVQTNQAASMDVILKSDGTLTIQEIEPLLGTLQDTVEGTIISVASPTQFQLVVTDLIPAATNSLIGSLRIGGFLTVNLTGNPTPNPFLVDTKGLPVESVAPGTLGNFQGATDTTPLRPGQTVAVHINSFTSTTTPPSSTSDTVTLRWSRFTATPVAPFTPSTFNLTSIPSFFNPTGTFLVQDFPGAPTTQNVTNFDGITDASQLNSAKPVGVRALFIENSTNTGSPAFVAAKVRQH
jgi:hypothetical protein